MRGFWTLPWFFHWRCFGEFPVQPYRFWCRNRLSLY